ncbi:MAG: MGH1-like glycoside hydrolase domain-containing protein [Limisphaerales bacterium]
MIAEARRLVEDATREKNWKRWGPYLAERQWATVREDYSPHGTAWDYFPHDHARRRAYRWGEDGLLGITDRECRLCFALALWNGKDPMLKERLFGLTGPQGNHGEDVKECYYYLDSTPTHSYLKALYKYPQAEFPYARLVEENRRRGRQEPEFELTDTGIFDGNRYFDMIAEYAKAAPDDILIRITIANRGPDVARLHLLPTLWYRNTWSWGAKHEGCKTRPSIKVAGPGLLEAEHAGLGKRWLAAGPGPDGTAPQFLFTENETNTRELFGVANRTPYVKDAFNEYVVHGRTEAVNPGQVGTKAATLYMVEVPARGELRLRLRLAPQALIVGQASRLPGGPPALSPGDAGEAAGGAGETPALLFGEAFDQVFQDRICEADEFYAKRLPKGLTGDEGRVVRQAYAGLLWSKQFYHYIVRDWLDGDPEQPPPPASRASGRNADWAHLYNRDIISMPDKWEYPWYAAWDLAFHMIAFARIDPGYAKEQLVLFLREWYMHPNGQLPAYEFNFSDVNPPVHAWSCWRVYKMTADRGQRDRVFLSRCFQKLVITFTWWVNRKDLEGRNLFAGGFLGLDNIGVFDRSKPLPTGGHLQQADGTAWMASFCATMLSVALELARDNPAAEDMASKFFEHFVAIADAMNTQGGTGLWDEEDGFYYDQLRIEGRTIPLKVRSLVGLIPLLAVEVLDDEIIQRLRGFKKRMDWFLEHRPDLSRLISYCCLLDQGKGRCHRLLAIPTREQLERVLRYVLDENEFLSPYGIRSLSRIHRDRPYIFRLDGQEHRVDYEPGESTTRFFGGNSNWRGPVWFPVNYLLIEALERYHYFYGDSLRVECPTGSGRMLDLLQVADELRCRLARLFLPDAQGRRPCHGEDRRYAEDPNWRNLVLFHEYFHGETGRGLGASHQTGWTALVTRLIQEQDRLNH